MELTIYLPDALADEANHVSGAGLTALVTL
jgi:hypothetical protein